MGNRGLEYFFRFSMILFLICLITLFIVDRGTNEYLLTLVSTGISGTVACICFFVIKSGKKK